MQTHLLINEAGAPQGAGAHTSFGGLPSVPAGFRWPVCQACEGHMQFLGQLRTNHPSSPRDKLLLLFKCDNDPGCCDEWEADSGGNAVLALPADASLSLAAPPAGGATVRATHHGARIDTLDGDYDEAREAWDTEGRRGRDILGQLGGEPSWIQGEEVPKCNECGQDMAFVAQLEEGPDYQTSMNFCGGGCAYVFDCGCSPASAKMVIQA